MSTSNRKYKDSVFVDLFSEDEKAKENFLSLYNALHGTELKDTDQLKNIRLDQVLYMSFYNDVSYLVDNKIIVLAEHQSTINPNMPLRCLEYVSRLYETIFESKEKYNRKLLHIPRPEFYVFYNGEETFPCDKTLKLSDAFIEKTEDTSLELTVKVININYQNRHPLLESCQTMQENILREYLKRKTKEVLNMLLAEYDYETDIAVQRAEERKIAFAEGIEQGINQGFADGSYQKALETAKLMRIHNYPIGEICTMTGLSQEEVENI